MCSFSFGRISLAILLFHCFCILSAGQFALSEDGPDSVQNPSGPKAEDVLPKPAEPLPPAIPERNVPTPPAVPGQNLSLSRPATKPPLAWRQKALLLSMDKFKNSPAAQAQNKNPLMRCVNGNYSDTIMILSSSCASLSFKSEQLNSNAGELLVSSNDGRSRLIFCVWEQSPSKTWISAGIDKGKNAETQKALTEILDTTCNTIARRGRI